MKIQERLLVSILPVVLITVFSVVTVSMYFSNKTLQMQAIENARLLSKSYSSKLNGQLILTKRISMGISSSIAKAENIEVALKKIRVMNRELHEIYFLSKYGVVEAMASNTPDDGYENLTLNLEWKDALENKKVTISDPREYKGQKSIFIFSPVLEDDSYGNELLGVLVHVIPSRVLFREFYDVVYGETGKLLIVNKNGKSIFGEDILELPSTTDMSPIVDSMRRLKSDISIYYDGLNKKFISYSPVEVIGWTLAISGSYSEFSKPIEVLYLINTFILIIGVVFSLIFIFLIVRSVVRPVTELTYMAKKINSGDMSLRSNINTKGEMGELSKALNGMLERLTSYNNQLEQDVSIRTLELQDTNQELKSTIKKLDIINRELEYAKGDLWAEMRLANRLQSVLLPKEPEIPGFDISAFMVTADQVGGDYYDVLCVDGHYWLLIGDVSGHGVTSGLIMMMVQTSIHIALSQNPDTCPTELLNLINKTIYTNICKLGGNRYITLTVFAFLKEGQFVYSGAHLPMILYRKKTNSLEVIETPGTWVGLVSDISGMNYNSNFQMESDDVLLLYTDGISEALTSSGDNYSQSKLAELFLRSINLNVKDICQSIKNQLDQLVTDDDVTVMILKRGCA